jgi:predicted heme/steroid binding protein
MAAAFEVKTLRSFTKAELARADGTDGRPALVAVDGKVYDVS